MTNPVPPNFHGQSVLISPGVRCNSNPTHITLRNLCLFLVGSNLTRSAQICKIRTSNTTTSSNSGTQRKSMQLNISQWLRTIPERISNQRNSTYTNSSNSSNELVYKMASLIVFIKLNICSNTLIDACMNKITSLL